MAAKSLGQHFLVSESVVAKIIEAASGMAGVLEVGPGPGVLTQRLSEMAFVTAIELDARMAAVLAESSPLATVVQADALQVDWAKLIRALPEPRAIVSNMPYNISGPMLGKVAESAPLIARAVLMMQKEVADKVLAQPGDRARGALSVHMQATFRVRKVAAVPAPAFEPPPKVASSVLAFEPDLQAEAAEVSETMALVRSGFTQPRKTLANNLASAGVAPKTAIERAIAGAGLTLSVRPHELTLGQWQELRRSLS